MKKAFVSMPGVHAMFDGFWLVCYHIAHNVVAYCNWVQDPCRHVQQIVKTLIFALQISICTRQARLHQNLLRCTC